MTDLKPLTVSPMEAATMLGVSRDHIYDLITKKHLEAGKSGSRTLITYASIVEYVERIKQVAS